MESQILDPNCGTTSTLIGQLCVMFSVESRLCAPPWKIEEVSAQQSTGLYLGDRWEPEQQRAAKCIDQAFMKGLSVGSKQGPEV